MTSPQESRERFEKEFCDVEIRSDGLKLLQWKSRWNGGDNRERYVSPKEILDFLDLATHSLITHAMQQIEAGKRTQCGHLGHTDEQFELCEMRNTHNAALDQSLIILQSLLPEQKK